MLCDHDRKAFSDLPDEVGETYGQRVSARLKQTWWRLLAARLDLPTLRQVLDGHLLDAERGRYFPRPSDVIAVLERAGGGRPGPDEAWALAIDTFDEAASVCVTEEILLAATAAAPVWERGDRVGARMAFKSAYERLVAERRRQGQPPQWRLSLGWDPRQRTEAAQRAVAAGRLSAEAVRHLLPAPDDARTPKRLTGTVVALPQTEEDATRQQLQALRERILRAVPPPPTPASAHAEARRAHIAQRKRTTAKAVERLGVRRGAP
ncbi:hypothetical protein G3480_26130 [Thiorhodococcus mannitoliphagus]|uniref:Uncharacterized protein n=1 Tax=Thiorhodococcus mannitoliphagus TaxID=329406 RepID=A0A6P1E8A4_9GAMM|nr:hypothetical protein [Thiorhodococcus mannitoliphagus]NEX23705.1 hypothetical protein [Thiorhodococcus mannitoliphagus]